MPPVPVPFGGGGTLPQWALLTSTDQGVSPHDPNARAGVGTGFDAATGRFTWVFDVGNTEATDGYREPMVRWTKKLTNLYADYDPAIDILDVAMLIHAMPNSATQEKYGLAIGLLDAGTANISILSGIAFGVRPNTATTYNHGAVGATTDTLGTAMASGRTPRRLVSTYRSSADGTSLVCNTKVENELLVFQASVADSAPYTPAASAWYLHIGHIHDSVVGTAGSTMIASVYTRRIRTSTLAALGAP
jgi:hypothetical protein